LYGRIRLQVHHKKESRPFSKTTLMIVRHLYIGRPDHLGCIAASRNRGRWVSIHSTNPRHQLIDHFDRKPRCTTGWTQIAHLHCFVRLTCLPLGSILPLRACFFRETGCPHPTEVHWTGGSLRVFRQFLWLEVGSVKVALSRPAGLLSRTKSVSRHTSGYCKPFGCSLNDWSFDTGEK
jgi:hypothetical protein